MRMRSRLGFGKAGPGRRGFTLVELLVVIAIIGILIALLLPAVQAAREAARRSQCTDNLKQLGLALQNYHDVNRSFPTMSVFGGGGPGLQQAYHHTWLTAILPFVEQQALYERTNKMTWAWGQPIMGTILPVLKCPSDADYPNDTSGTWGLAITDYGASEGYHWWSSAYNVLGDNVAREYSGVFSQTQWNRMADIPDGTSNVVVVSECNSTGYKWGPFRTSGTGTKRAGGGERVFRTAFVGTGVAGQCCETGIFSKPDNSGVKTGGWFKAAPHAFTPSYLTAWGPKCEWPGAGGVHPAVTLVLLADGSVRPASDTISWPVWVQINARQDGVSVQNF